MAVRLAGRRAVAAGDFARAGKQGRIHRAALAERLVGVPRQRRTDHATGAEAVDRGEVHVLRGAVVADAAARRRHPCGKRRCLRGQALGEARNRSGVRLCVRRLPQVAMRRQAEQPGALECHQRVARERIGAAQILLQGLGHRPVRCSEGRDRAGGFFHRRGRFEAARAGGGGVFRA